MSSPSHNDNAKCPACEHRANPIIASVASPTPAMVFITSLLCLCCACCLLTNVQLFTLAFYCERCGLRQVTEDNKDSQAKYSYGNLTSWPSETQKPAPLRQVPNLKAATSPLGLPPAVDRQHLINVKKRYLSLRTVQVLNIELDSHKLPSKVTNVMPSAPTYIIEALGIPPVDPTAKKDPQYLQHKCAWSSGGTRSSRQTPHFRVSIQAEGRPTREVAHIGLYGGSNWNADITAVRETATFDNSTEKSGTKKTYESYQMLAAEEKAWSTTGGGVLWTSTEGMMLFSERTVADAEKVKGKMLCLLDAYDRLIVALRKVSHPEGKGKIWQMRVYAELSEDFLGEIVACFTALRCQKKRIFQEHMFDSS